MNGPVIGKKENGLAELFLLPYKRYAAFSGRASLKEFTVFFTSYCLLVIFLAAVFILSSSFKDVKSVLTALAVFSALISCLIVFLLIPSLSICWRRLHDTGRTGAWMLLALTGVLPLFTPVRWLSLGMFFFVLVCQISLLIMLCLPGTKGDNRFGPPPLR